MHRLAQSNLAVDLTLFTEAYSERIASLRDDGSLENVVSLGGPPVEQEPVDCSSELIELETIE